MRGLGHSRRGYMLAFVFGMIFFLITVVAVMHHQQVTARRTYTRGAADLNFEQARRFSVARALGVNSIPGTESLAVTGDIEPAVVKDPLAAGASKLWEELPNLMVDKETKDLSANSKMSVTPETYDATLKVFGDRIFEVVARESDAYAIFAPRGKIAVADTVAGWANPSFDIGSGDGPKAEKATSGVPAMLYAQKDIEVNELVYGSAYSREGPVDLGDKLSVGFIGHGPKRDYSAGLESSLDAVRRDLDAIARANGEKTSSIKGGVFDRAEKVVELFSGDSNAADTFSPTLQEAMAFNMPIIPGATKHPPFVIEVWFNVPWVSDFADFGEPQEIDSADDKKDRENLKKLNDAFEAAEAKVADLTDQLAKATSESQRDDIQTARGYLS